MSLDLNLQSIILLLFFIAPGFLFTRTYAAYRPRYYREPTGFEQFVLAIVGSTTIHAVIFSALSLLALVFWGITDRLLYFNQIFDPAVPFLNYPLPLIAAVILGSIIYLTLSLILARRFASFLGRWGLAERSRWWHLILGEDPPEPFILWHTVLQIEPLNMNLIPPYLTVQMRNGEYFEGNLYRLRLVGDEENTVELALHNVYHRATQAESDSAGSLKPLTALPNQVLLLKSTDILWLSRSDSRH